jgi:hypothetical protein
MNTLFGFRKGWFDALLDCWGMLGARVDLTANRQPPTANSKLPTANSARLHKLKPCVEMKNQVVYKVSK